MKKFLLAAIVVLVANLVFAQIPKQVEASAEEYAVYSAVIANMFTDEKVAGESQIKVKASLLIQDITDLDRPRRGEFQGDRYFKRFFPTLADGVAQDYEARNNEPARLKESFDLKMKYALVDAKENQKLFNKGGGWWEEFYKRYPGSGGFIILSRVGFNAAKTQALVNIQHACGGLCGTGHYVLLEKSGDRWQVIKASMIWIA